MQLFVQPILGLKILVQDYHSDDDICSAISDSDSNILVTVEKADFVYVLDDNSSMLAVSEGDFNTYVTFK